MKGPNERANLLTNQNVKDATDGTPPSLGTKRCKARGFLILNSWAPNEMQHREMVGSMNPCSYTQHHVKAKDGRVWNQTEEWEKTGRQERWQVVDSIDYFVLNALSNEVLDTAR